MSNSSLYNLGVYHDCFDDQAIDQHATKCLLWWGKGREPAFLALTAFRVNCWMRSYHDPNRFFQYLTLPDNLPVDNPQFVILVYKFMRFGAK